MLHQNNESGIKNCTKRLMIKIQIKLRIFVKIIKNRYKKILSTQTSYLSQFRKKKYASLCIR